MESTEEVIRGHSRSFEVIRGHSRSFEVIRALRRNHTSSCPGKKENALISKAVLSCIMKRVRSPDVPRNVSSSSTCGNCLEVIRGH